MTTLFNLPWSKERRRELRGRSTQAEILLWQHLRASRLDGIKFRRQFGIGSYIVDFYCPSQRLVIEVDGDSHFFEEAIAYDAERTAYLQSKELRVVRFTNDQIFEDLETVLSHIRLQLSNPSLRRRG